MDPQVFLSKELDKLVNAKNFQIRIYKKKLDTQRVMVKKLKTVSQMLLKNVS